MPLGMFIYVKCERAYVVFLDIYKGNVSINTSIHVTHPHKNIPTLKQIHMVPIKYKTRPEVSEADPRNQKVTQSKI